MLPTNNPNPKGGTHSTTSNTATEEHLWTTATSPPAHARISPQQLADTTDAQVDINIRDTTEHGRSRNAEKEQEARRGVLVEEEESGSGSGSGVAVVHGLLGEERKKLEAALSRSGSIELDLARKKSTSTFDEEDDEFLLEYNEENDLFKEREEFSYQFDLESAPQPKNGRFMQGRMERDGAISPMDLRSVPPVFWRCAQRCQRCLPEETPDSPGRNGLTVDRGALGLLKTFVHMVGAVWDRLMFDSSWFFLFVLGVISAITAWCLDEFVELLVTSKLNLIASAAQDDWVSHLLWTVFMMCQTLTAVFITRSISSLASGSGIPEMKSILSGFSIKEYLSMKTYAAKLLGLILALASGLVIGKEGPFVHLSCIIARQMLKLPAFDGIRQSPALIRQVLAAACAVGVSSSLGAPIGGVLFSIEVTSTFYQVHDYWKGFFCAVCGAFMFKELSYFGQTRSKVISLFTTHFKALPYSFGELPFFILLSLLCGYCGGLFVKVYSLVAKWHRQSRFDAIRSPYVFALLVALCTSLANFIGGGIMALPLRKVIDDLFVSGSLHKDAENIQNWDSDSIVTNLSFFVAAKFLLAAISNTLCIPCGVFTPIFAIGAALGRLYGEVVFYFGGSIAAGYALVGAAAFTAGVTGTVSTAVIVFELTNQLSYMLPVLLSVLIGRAAAGSIGLNIYDSLAKSRNLPKFFTLSKQSSYELPIGSVMRSNSAEVVCLARFPTVKEMERALLAAAAIDVGDIAIVDSTENKLYLGSVKVQQLDLIIKLQRSKGITSTRSTIGAENRYRSTSESLLGASHLEWRRDGGSDITKLCDMDESVPGIKYSMSLSELRILAQANPRVHLNTVFVTRHGKVIGRLVMRDLEVLFDQGLL